MAAVLAAVVPVSLAGCADDGTAGPERGVTVEEIQEPQYFYEGEYLGQEVTVSAAVTQVIGPGSFELAGREYGDDSLLVMTSGPVAVSEGQVVSVTGTVGQYHRLAEGDYAPGTYDRYEKYETEAYLYDATLRPLEPGNGG